MPPSCSNSNMHAASTPYPPGQAGSPSRRALNNPDPAGGRSGCLPAAAGWHAGVLGVTGTLRPRRVSGPGRGCLPGGAGRWRSGQDPGSVAAGQAVPEQGAQVDRGAPGVQPGVVLGGAEVAEPDPAAVLGGGPGDDPLDGGPGGVGLLEIVGAGLGAGGTQQVLVRVD